MIATPEVGGEMRIPVKSEFIVKRIENAGDAECYMTENGRVIFVTNAELQADPVNARELAVRRWLSEHLRDS